MRDRIGNVLWGLVFIILGVGFAGNVLWHWDFELFFDGWWTLFIIIPCLISIVQRGPSTGNIVGLCIGGMLLVSEYYNIDFLWDLIFPAILIIIGISFIFRNTVRNNRNYNSNSNRNYNSNGNGNGNGAYHDASYKDSADSNLGGNNTYYKDTDYDRDFNYQKGSSSDQVSSIFTSRVVDYSNLLFTGLTVNSVFGATTVDLRTADVKDGAYIDITSLFGGVDIYVPADIEVRVQQTPIFGGVSNSAANPHISTAVINVNAVCIFGGVNIKS